MDYEKMAEIHEAEVAKIVELEAKVDQFTEELKKAKEDLKAVGEELTELWKRFNALKADVLKEIEESK
ncbi:hypothetical protein AALP_AA6G120500 [Arabis alpina]|uniref:Uncharacterized protein n=1 Tax=Arabis alpina TaxID=50452 RepID=A0A087GNP8_ARAAL|nr:hypothetical protein AALP_AA6G120500 [Arabis alpina]